MRKTLLSILLVFSSVCAFAFSMSDIHNWSGEGSNEAALVIQWNVDGETSAMAFGYRWDGEATGYDMIAAVAKNNPRLYYLTESTSYGNTIAGLGWDADNDGDLGLMLDGTRHEINADGYVITDQYNYDQWTAADADDMWCSGWYKGFWSYWVKNAEADDWGFASTGASGRVLTSGCWDGWNFSANMSPNPWKEIVSAPSNQVPTGVEDNVVEKVVADVQYFNLQGQQSAEPFKGVNIVKTIYTDGTSTTAKVLR